MKIIRQATLFMLFIVAIGPLCLFVSLMNIDRILRGEVKYSDLRELYSDVVRIK